MRPSRQPAHVTPPSDDTGSEDAADDVGASVTDLAAALRDGGVSERLEAAREIAARARDDAGDLAPVVADLAGAAGDDLPEVRHHALGALARLARDDPTACEPALETLCDHVDVPDDEPTPDDRSLHAAVKDRSLAGRLGDLSGRSSTRAWTELEYTLYVFARVLTTDPDAALRALEPRLPELRDLLACDHERVRGQVTALFAYLAEAYPAEVRSATDALEANLAIDEPSVRASAVWALRYVGTPAARRAIRSIADDEDEEVRAAARQALAAMDPVEK